MLIAELTAPREFRLAQQTIEEPGPGEVQVRVRAVGICGSDLHSYAEGAVGDSPCVYPMVLGHEPAGTVVKAGAGVDRLGGAATAPRLNRRIYCYHCEFCRSGRHNVCSQHPLPEHTRPPRLLPRICQPAGGQPAGYSRRGFRSNWPPWPNRWPSACIR